MSRGVYSQWVGRRGVEGRGELALSLWLLPPQGSEAKFRLKGQNLTLLGPPGPAQRLPAGSLGSGVRPPGVKPATATLAVDLGLLVRIYEPQCRPP